MTPFLNTGLAGDEREPVTGQLDDDNGLDPISDGIGRDGFIANHTIAGCLVPGENGPEAAEVDRYYFLPEGEDGEAVLVDVLPGGSEREVAAQEAERHVDLKRQWCEAHGLAYRVEVDMLSPVALY